MFVNAEYLKTLEKTMAEIQGKMSFLMTKLDSVQKENDALKKESAAVFADAHKEVELLRIRMDSAIDNVKQMVEMYSNYFSENFKTIFGDKFIQSLKEMVINEVKAEAKHIAADASEDYLYDKLKKFLTVEIRKAVVAHGGDKLEENALAAVVDSIVKNVLPQMIIERPEQAETMKTSQEQTSAAERILPFTTSKELTHYNFNKMLDCLKAGLVPMLVGPAGTGKSTAAEQAARALGLRFYMANRVANSYELIGYNNASGNYVPTQFYEAYKNGGLFLFDEIDGSDPEALVTVNTAIAQGYMPFPCGQVPMHPDFKLVAAGNTYGTGPDSQYCGRNQLDSATLDRFVVLDWDYDKNIESKLCKHPDLLEFAWALRTVCEANHINIIISTRGILATDKLLDSKSFSLAENIQSNLLEGVKLDTLNTIKGGLKNICNMTNGKYIDALDTIIKNQTTKNK